MDKHDNPPEFLDKERDVDQMNKTAEMPEATIVDAVEIKSTEVVEPAEVIEPVAVTELTDTTEVVKPVEVFAVGLNKPTPTEAVTTETIEEQKKKPRWLGFIAFALAVCIIIVFSMGYFLREGFLTPERKLPSSRSTQIADKINQGSFSLEQSAKRTDRPDAKAMSIAEIAKQGKPSVVAILTEKQLKAFSSQFDDGSYVREAAGSGFIVSKDGYIVTNAHVVRGTQKIKVQLFDNKSFEAKLVGIDDQTDLAVIKIEGNDFVPALLGDSTQLIVGELAVAIGNPTGELNGTVTAGIISALNRTIKVASNDNVEVSLNVLQTDATINPGNSGGALFNSFGEVIAINTAKAKQEGQTLEGLGFAIPIDFAKPIVEQLIKFGAVKDRPFLGIAGVAINKATADYYNLTPGVMVKEISSDGPAKKAGVEVKDIITKIDQTTISDIYDLRSLLATYKAGQDVSITVVRNGREITLPLKLEADTQKSSTPSKPNSKSVPPTTSTVPSP